MTPTAGGAGTVGPPRSRAALAATTGFVGLAGLELALALGAPLGQFAMGGAYTQLTTRLRVAAAILALFWPLAALVVLRRGGYPIVPIPPGVARCGTWGLVALLGLGVLMNLASPSRWERLLMTPFAATLLALCLIVARSRTETDEQPQPR